MVQSTRTFRVFVSSTFDDLKAERNVLQEEVFPKLKTLCAEHGARFQAIDLRWGVSEEAGRDHQTMAICLEEVKRCQRTSPKPNFVVLLGDRYGWCPLPASIDAAEFEEVIAAVPDEEKALLVFDEAKPEEGNGWYRRDDNAVPPVYHLRERKINLPVGASDEEKKAAQDEEGTSWDKDEVAMRKALRNALGTLGWHTEDERRTKYETSATEQEILRGALAVPDAHEHVFAFFRTLSNLDRLVVDIQAEPSIGVADLDRPPPEKFVDITVERAPDGEARERLNRLKRQLRDHLPGNVRDQYHATWEGGCISRSHLDQLCHDVYDALARVITVEVDRIGNRPEQDKEIEDHKRFGEDRAGSTFVGRLKPLERIRTYVASGDRHPLVVFGASGSGKSALIATAARQAKERADDAVIVRFVGATPESSIGRSLLSSLCRQIARRYADDGLATGRGEEREQQGPKAEADVPADYRELCAEFPRQLARATAARPLIVFLDALDQLRNSDGARILPWLPRDLPEHVRLIVSTTTAPAECLDALRTELPETSLVELEPMTREEGDELLRSWLRDARRTLQPDQFAYVLDRFAPANGDAESGGLPLYLKIVFEEVRRWRSYSHAAATALESGIPGVIGHNLFKRLSDEGSHGRVMVSRSLACLGAAKNGLSEDEMLGLLSADEEVLADFRRRSPRSPRVFSLPVVVWSRLYFDLEPYLSECRADGASLMTFYHRQLSDAVTEHYLAGDEKRNRHRALARYFGSQELEAKGAPNLRKLSELPYHQAHGELWEESKKTLMDLDFLYAKVKAMGAPPLIADYEEVSRLGKEDRDLAVLQDALRLSAHVVTQDPSQVATQLVGRVLGHRAAGIQAFVEHARGWKAVAWLCATTRGLVAPSSLRHTLPTQSTMLALTRDGRVIADSSDGSLRVWDLGSGAELLTWAGAAEGLASLAATPDGRRIVIGTKHGLLRVWDAVLGKELLNLRDRKNAIHAVAVTADGRVALSASADGTFTVWDLDRGSALYGLGVVPPDRGAARPVLGPVAVSASGNRAVFAVGEVLVAWDLGRRACLFNLTGHKSRINAVAVTADGSRALSGSDDRTAKVWDLQHGVEASTLLGSSGSIYSVAITADGGLALAGSQDKKVLAWGIRKRPTLPTMTGHHATINAVAVTTKGTVISVGDDGELKIWDIDSGEEQWAAASVRARWLALAADAHGKIAISGASDRDVVVWNLERRQVTAHLAVNGVVNSAAMTPDGNRVVLGTSEGLVEIWNPETARKLRTIDAHRGPVLGLAVSADGTCAVSGSADGTVRVWNVERGEKTHELTGHTGHVLAVALAPDKRHVVSASQDASLRIWSCAGDQGCRVLTGHSAPVTAVAVTPDGERILSGSWDRKLMVWDLMRGAHLWTLTGHTGWVQAVAVAPDGRAVSGSSDRTLRVWDLRSEPRCLMGHAEPVREVAVTPDGRWAVSRSALNGPGEGELKVWDLHQTLDPERAPHQRQVPAVAIGGWRAISGSEDGTVKVWDVNSGLELLNLTGHATSEGARSKFGFGKRVDAVAITSDGRLAISGSWDGTIKVWDLDRVDGDPRLHDLEGHRDGVYALAMAADGRRVVSASWDQAVKVWDPRNGVMLRELEVPSREIAAMAISEDGQRAILATRQVIAESALTFEVWHLEQGRKIGELNLPGAERRVAAVTPNGVLAVCVVNDHTLEVWNLEHRLMLHLLQGHTENVVAAALTPDGGRCVSASADHALKLWDLQTGDLIASFTGESALQSCAVASNGLHAIAGERSGRVHVLRLVGRVPRQSRS